MNIGSSNTALPILRKSCVRCYVFLGVITAVITAPSLFYDFVLDDHLLIVDNPTITSWGNLGHILASDYFARIGYQDMVGYYRPLTNLSYLVDHMLWGLSPTGFHLTNVVLGIVTTLLAFRIATLLLPMKFALLAGLFFALHPGRVQAVGMITARSDLLAAVFGFWLVMKWLQTPRGKPPGFLAGILLFFALLGKEASITVAAALGIWSLSGMDGVPTRKRVSTWCALVLPVVAYVALRGLCGITPIPFGHQSATLLLGSAGRVFGFYLRTLLIPLDTSTAPLLPLSSLSWSLMLLAFIPLLTPLRWLPKYRAIAVGTSWVGLSLTVLLLPQAIRNPTIEGYLAPSPRFLYIPALGAALFWAALLNRIVKKYVRLERATILIGILWAALLAVEFLPRLAVFENDITNDKAAIRDLQRVPIEKRTPQFQASLLLSTGMVLRVEERLQEASAALEKAIELDPNSLRTRVLLASLWHDTERDSLAQELLRDVLDPSRIGRWSHTELSIYYMTGSVILSDILMSNDRPEEALTWLHALVERYPASWKAHSKLALVLAEAGDTTAALQSFERALALVPRGRWEREVRKRITDILSSRE
jgi:tetratricopeptide (TPR) repeat protein